MNAPANARRGEVPIGLDGRRHIMRLTLQGLAELEVAFKARDLSALGERFSGGSLSSRDLIAILGAGLRGGGLSVPDEEVAQLNFDDGLSGAVCAAMQLLIVTFGETEAARPEEAGHPRPQQAEGG